MSTLKEEWKKVGDDLEKLGKSLESSIVKTVKAGAKAVSDWADNEEKQSEPPKADVTVEPEEKKE